MNWIDVVERAFASPYRMGAIYFYMPKESKLRRTAVNEGASWEIQELYFLFNAKCLDDPNNEGAD